MMQSQDQGPYKRLRQSCLFFASERSKLLRASTEKLWVRFPHIFLVPTLSLTFCCCRCIAVPPERVGLSSQLCWWKSRHYFGSILGFNLCLALAAMGADPIRCWGLLLKSKVLVAILHMLLIRYCKPTGLIGLVTDLHLWGTFMWPEQQLNEVTSLEDWACGLFMRNRYGSEKLEWWLHKPLACYSSVLCANNNSVTHFRNQTCTWKLGTHSGSSQWAGLLPASSLQLARVSCSFLIHSVARLCLSLVLGATQRCLRKPRTFSELWHCPHWQQKPPTHCYLLPLFIPMMSSSSSQLLISVSYGITYCSLFDSRPHF